VSELEAEPAAAVRPSTAGALARVLGCAVADITDITDLHGLPAACGAVTRPSLIEQENTR